MVKIFRDIQQFQIFRSNLDVEIKLSGHPHSLGLVPTMGNLHIGHLSLINKSLKDNETTVVTIFVNPKQFGPNEDFQNYPRTLKHDIHAIKELMKGKGYEDRKLVIFAPATIEDIYPKGFATSIGIESLSNTLCGEYRPGHFSGVCTVIYRLFNIIKPDCAYFGQKDYQQYLIIKKLVSDLGLGINIFPMPTKRDESGLALSSRNQFIESNEMSTALSLPNTITKIKDLLSTTPWEKAESILSDLIQTVKGQADWDYLEVLDSLRLTKPDADTRIVVIAGALRLSATRIIDNKLCEIVHAR